LTNQANFLHGTGKSPETASQMTADEKCKKSGLQNQYKVVYNHSIAVTPPCHCTLGRATPPVNTNKKEDCSER
jgi:hypothetical protein